MENLDFSHALKRLKEGAIITRPLYSELGMYLEYHEPPKLEFARKKPCVVIYFRDEEPKIYRPTLEDILALDWTIA